MDIIKDNLSGMDCPKMQQKTQARAGKRDSQGWQKNRTEAVCMVLTVAKPGTVAEILKETGVQGWIIVALLEEIKGLKGMASVKFGYTRCIKQGRRVAQTRWVKLEKYILWALEEDGELFQQGFGSEENWDRGNQICSMLSADNFWIMIESNMGLQRMMGEWAEETVRKGMEPKQDSL